MVDTADLNPAGRKLPYRFESDYEYQIWIGDRAAYCASLENWWGVKASVGSYPTLSAIYMLTEVEVVETVSCEETESGRMSRRSPQIK